MRRAMVGRRPRTRNGARKQPLIATLYGISQPRSSPAAACRRTFEIAAIGCEVDDLRCEQQSDDELSAGRKMRTKVGILLALPARKITAAAR